jgi:hypothetical protein
MGTSPKVHQTNGTDNVDQTLSAKDRRLLARMGKLWGGHAERDLGTRHRTGKLLNERLGSPDRRQPHARRVLKMVADKVGIAESDLNRMRWFAHSFVDVAALRQSHREITNWTRFKEVLPSLMPAKGGQARKPAADPSSPALRGVVKSCTNLASKLDGLDFRLGKAEREGFLDAFRELGEAVSRRFRVRVEVAVGVKERKPVVTKRSGRVARA